MRGRLVVATLVLYVAFVVALTALRGMAESWFPVWALTVVVVAALVFVLVARAIAGPGWRRLLVRRDVEFGPWVLLLAVCSAATLVIGTRGATAMRGDLPALLVVGLVAAAPVTVALAARVWWWLPRVAAARAREGRSADDDEYPGQG